MPILYFSEPSFFLQCHIFIFLNFLLQCNFNIFLTFFFCANSVFSEPSSSVPLMNFLLPCHFCIFLNFLLQFHFHTFQNLLLQCHYCIFQNFLLRCHICIFLNFLLKCHSEFFRTFFFRATSLFFWTFFVSATSVFFWTFFFSDTYTFFRTSSVPLLYFSWTFYLDLGRLDFLCRLWLAPALVPVYCWISTPPPFFTIFWFQYSTVQYGTVLHTPYSFRKLQFLLEKRFMRVNQNKING